MSDSDEQSDESSGTTADPYGGAAKRFQCDNIVEYFGSGVSSCGYCKRDGTQAEGRRSHDMRTYKLTADVYQKLIDRGWRRSGNYCYNPVNKHTCCPNYSISCKALKFVLTRSQRRCIEKLNTFLINGSTRPRVRLFSETMGQESRLREDYGDIRNNFDKIEQSSKARDRRFVQSCRNKMRLHGASLDEAITMILNKPRNNRHRPSGFTLEDHLYPRKISVKQDVLHNLTPKHRLEFRLVHVDSKESRDIRRKEHDILLKYQQVVHKEGPEDWTLSRYRNFLVKSPIQKEPMTDWNYCPGIADGSSEGTSLSKDVFADQSDEFVLSKPPELPTHYGTYHCLYLLDGELIAVGVLDVLPKCLTTVYFFYDPKFGFLNLGIYSALVEISMVRQMAKHYCGPAGKNELVHYYMGFYVHECKKMHYKVTFKPSHMLCSETYHYVAVEKCLAELKDKKYARFDTDCDPEFNDNECPSLIDLFTIPVSAPVSETSTKLVEYLRWIEQNLDHYSVDLLVRNILVPYARLTGAALVSKILLQTDAIHRALVDRHRKTVAASDGIPESQTNSSTVAE